MLSYQRNLLPRFRSITQTYFRGTQGAVLVFDLTDRTSFTRLQEWLFELELHCRRDPVILLLGNKEDLEDRREVDKTEAMEFARRHNILYLETSVCISEEVEYAFEVKTALGIFNIFYVIFKIFSRF